MSELPDDLCPRPDDLPEQPTTPLAAPIWLSSVYQCRDPDQADALLSGAEAGYVYARDAHPNAELLAEKCRKLHGVERGVVTASGMGALALAALSQLQAGDHVVVSNQLYGRSGFLLTEELKRLGIESTRVDTCDLAATAAAFRPNTRLAVAETITNPLLRVSDIAALAKIAHAKGALLLVDNTFASPVLCRPAELGADLVLESLTKIMNGHSDVVLGFLGGRADAWQRVPGALASWGMTAGPFDCWLAARGLSTLPLRMERAAENARRVAELLDERRAGKKIADVQYPGLPGHPDHTLAARQFGGRFGAMVTFTLAGGREAARRFIAQARRIPFCPSLGDLCTTLSHPESTSHRSWSPAERAAAGISGGTIRLSIGVESPEFVLEAVREGLGT